MKLALAIGTASGFAGELAPDVADVAIFGVATGLVGGIISGLNTLVEGTEGGRLNRPGDELFPDLFPKTYEQACP